MDNDIRIALRNDPDHADIFKDPADGRVYLDLPVGFEHRRNKVVEKLKNFDSIEFDNTFGFSIEKTQRNLAALQSYLRITRDGNKYDPIEIDFVLGGSIDIQADLIVTDRNTKLECEVMLDRDHWLRRMKGLKLSDVELGTYTHTSKTNQELHDTYLYEDGDNGTWQPFCDYGMIERLAYVTSPTTQRNSRYIPVAYEKPFFSPKWILENVFKHIGYSFEAPILSDDIGRSLWMYLIKSDFGTGVEETEHHSALARYASDGDPILVNYGEWLNVPFPDIGLNGAGNYDVRSQHFSGDVTVNVEVNFKFYVEFGDDSDEAELEFRLVRRTGSFSRSIVGDSYGEVSFTEDSDLTEDPEEVTFSETGVCLFSSHYVALQYRLKNKRVGQTCTITPKADAEIFYSVERVYLQEDQEYQVKDMMNEILVTDFFKEMIRLFLWELETDTAERKLYAYSPYTTYVEGRKIDGYYKENVINDISDKIVPNSDKTRYPERGSSRFVRTRFKAVSGGSREEEDENEPIFSILTDRGDSYPDVSEEERDLKYIEPTPNVRLGSIGLYRNGLDGIRSVNYSEQIEYFLAEMKGGGDEAFHWDIGIRIVMARGVCRQYEEPPTDSRGRYKLEQEFTRKGEPSSVLAPLATQQGVWRGASNDPVAEIFYDANNLTFNLDLSKGGPDGHFNPFSNIHRRVLIEELEMPEVEVLAFIDEEEFRTFKKRELYTFNLEGFPATFKLIEIRDFDYFSGLSTPIVFQQISEIRQYGSPTDTNITDNGIELDPKELVNRPRIFGSRTGVCVAFSIGGINVDTIVSVDYRYYLLSDPDTILDGNDTTLLGEVCNQTTRYAIYAIVTYDDSSTAETNVLQIEPCSTDYPNITTELRVNDGGEAQVKATISTAGGSPFSVVSFFVRELPSGPLQVYTNDTWILISEDVYFNAQVSIDADGCNGYSINATQRYDDKLIIKSSDNFGILFEQKFDGSQQIIRTGSAPKGDYDDYIIYRLSASGRWVRWDEENNLSSDYIQAKRILISLNGDGRVIKSDTITFTI